MQSDSGYQSSLSSRVFQNCEYRFDRLLLEDEGHIYVKTTLVSQKGKDKCPYMC